MMCCTGKSRDTVDSWTRSRGVVRITLLLPRNTAAPTIPSLVSRKCVPGETGPKPAEPDSTCRSPATYVIGPPKRIRGGTEEPRLRLAVLLHRRRLIPRVHRRPFRGQRPGSDQIVDALCHFA